MKTENTPIALVEENQKLQEAVYHLIAERQQLYRIIWLAVQASGGRLTLDESKVDPLWRLDKNRLPDNRLVLASSVKAPPTAEQINKLVLALMGTKKLIEDVQKEVGLEEWPPDYLAFQLRDKLAIMNGLWTDATIARGLAGGQQANN